MHSNVKHRWCPRCGGVASTSSGHGYMHHAVHGLQHGLAHGNPVALGLGLLAAGAQLVNRTRYSCGHCGHEFFSR